jgi:hypothetical protein
VTAPIPKRSPKFSTRTTVLHTDESGLYTKLSKEFASHEAVNHAGEEYARGTPHTNTIEGFFSIFKRGVKGVYRYFGEQHLRRYLAEFDFCYNALAALGYNDSMPKRLRIADLTKPKYRKQSARKFLRWRKPKLDFGFSYSCRKYPTENLCCQKGSRQKDCYLQTLADGQLLF